MCIQDTSFFAIKSSFKNCCLEVVAFPLLSVSLFVFPVSHLAHI